MNLSTTLYTLAAAGFFTLMVNRPAIEIPTSKHNSTSAITAETSSPTEPAATNTPATETTTTANEPPHDSNAVPANQSTPTNTN